MNRTKFVTTAAIAVGSILAIAPAFAQTNMTGEAGRAQQLVGDATTTVQQIKSDPHFDDLLKQAKGVVIMPNLVKGAFVVGGEGAQAVLLKHHSDGSWSNPAFLTIGSISLGAQAGGEAGPAAMILMTDKALNDFAQTNDFSLNANAGLTIVNDAKQDQAQVGHGDIVLWSNQGGAFAGADISAADVKQNSDEDRAYYGKRIDAMQILGGQADQAHAEKLKSALPT